MRNAILKGVVSAFVVFLMLLLAPSITTYVVAGGIVGVLGFTVELTDYLNRLEAAPGNGERENG